MLLPFLNVTLFLWMLLSLAFGIFSVTSSDVCVANGGPDSVLSALIEGYAYDATNPPPSVGDANYAASTIGIFSYYIGCEGEAWFEDHLDSATDYIDTASAEINSVIVDLTAQVRTRTGSVVYSFLSSLARGFVQALTLALNDE